MTVRIYKSTDTSAPTLSGTAGDMITVLDAVLVNGYGTQTAAGWTKSFSGTATATYRQGTGSTQFYLHMNDNGPGAGTTKEGRMFGSETASAVLTGTNLFPTVAQLGNGLFFRKSTTADSTTRPWIIAADARTVYMFILTGDTVSDYMAFMFGEFFSYKSSDAYRCMIVGRATENSGAAGVENLNVLQQIGATTNGHYIVRDHQANVGAIAAGKLGDWALSNSSGNLVGTLGFTNGPDNRIYIAPIRVNHIVGSNFVRGRLRGFWHWCHPIANCSDGDTFSGTGDLAGRSFTIIKTCGSGVYVIETSDTWDTN